MFPWLREHACIQWGQAYNTKISMHWSESHNSIEPCISLSRSSNNFLSFFNNKITSIRDKIYYFMPPTDTDLSSNTGT